MTTRAPRFPGGRGVSDPVGGHGRGSRRLDWLSGTVAVLVLGFVLVGIGLPLLGLRVFSGADLLLAVPPWSSSQPTGMRPTNQCIGDTVDVIIPSRAVAADHLRDGDYPLWNPLISGGTTLDATPDMGTFSPVALPFLVLPAWLAPAYVKLLEMIASIGGMYLFLRRLVLSKPAALLGGLLFASCGFMVAWTNWPQTNVGAFVPILFWAVERFVQLRTVRSAIVVALVVAALLLGGFPAVTGYAIYAAAAYLLVRLLWQHRDRPIAAVRPVGAMVGALGLGVALAAFQVLPFVHRLKQLNLGYRETHGSHLDPSGLATIGLPRPFGSCAGGVYFGSTNEVELTAFIGSAALVLVVVSLLGRPGPGVPAGVRGYLVVGVLVLTELAFFGGAPLALAQHLPVFSNNPVGRIRILFGLFLAALAALGYDRLIRRRAPTRARPWALAAGAGVWALAVVASLLVLRTARRDGAAAGQAHYVDGQILWALAGAGVVLVAAAVVAFLPRGRRLALIVIPVVVVAQSLAFVLPFWPRIPRDQFYPVTATHRFLSENLGHDRFAADGKTMLPGSNIYYGLRSVVGHAFTETEYKDLLSAVDPKAFASPTYSQLDGTPQVLASPLLDRMAVRYFVEPVAATPWGAQRTVGAPSGTLPLVDGLPITVQVASERLRGIGVTFAEPFAPTDRYARLDVDLLDSAGTVLQHGSRRLFSGAAAGTVVFVPVVETPAASGLRARITLHATGGRAPLRADGATPVVTTVTGGDDGLRLVFADGAAVYQRLTALPRIRWADSASVVPAGPAQVQALSKGTLPPTSVVLSSPGPPASGRPARVSVEQDSGDEIRARVSAAGGGYLVIADSLLHGWQASVDGRAAPLLPADHAFGAVYVPAGDHVVSVSYRPPGLRAGVVLSLVALFVLVALWLLFRPGSRLLAARRARQDDIGELPPTGELTKHPSSTSAVLPGHAAPAETRRPSGLSKT